MVVLHSVAQASRKELNVSSLLHTPNSEKDSEKKQSALASSANNKITKTAVYLDKKAN